RKARAALAIRRSSSKTFRPRTRTFRRQLAPPGPGRPQAEFLQRFPQLALLRLRQRLRLRDLKEGNGQAVPVPWEHLPHLPLALLRLRQRPPPRLLKGAEE